MTGRGVDHQVDGTTPVCLYCGEPERAEIFEVWSLREFTMETCCEGMHHAVNEFLAHDSDAGLQWLRTKGLDRITGQKSRRLIEDAGQLLIDWQLRIVDINQATAKEFVARYHRHCPPPAGWRFGAGIANGHQLIGVVMVGRPVARMIDASTTVEVNRLCVRDDLPSGLTWNACSMLYAWAAREARRRGYRKIITYTLETEAGTSLRAAGWHIEHTTRGGSWDTPTRRRVDKTTTCAKHRWSPVTI